MAKANRQGGRAERAAAIHQAQDRAERNRRLALIGAAVVVLGVIAAAVFWYSSGTTKPASDSGIATRAGDQSLFMGPDDAAVKVVVYEDFLCPFCREFEMASRDFLQADAKAGKVQVEYRPFHLLPDDYSSRALTTWAAVLKDGTPAQALALHDLLYDKQPYEQATDKPSYAALVDLAAQAGADKSAITSAVATPDAAFIDAADAAASKAGVTGTPTVFVDGNELTGSTVTGMADNLEKLIAGAK